MEKRKEGRRVVLFWKGGGGCLFDYHGQGGGRLFLWGRLLKPECKKNVLLKLKKKVDGSEWYTLIQPHPNYADIDFGVLVNNFSGYTKPKNAFMPKYVFLGILPKSIANRKTTQGFRSNGIMLEFWNCDANPNSFFALFPNHHHQLPYGHGETSVYENSRIVYFDFFVLFLFLSFWLVCLCALFLFSAGFISWKEKKKVSLYSNALWQVGTKLNHKS